MHGLKWPFPDDVAAWHPPPLSPEEVDAAEEAARWAWVPYHSAFLKPLDEHFETLESLHHGGSIGK